MNRSERRRKEKQLRKAYNLAPNMIHERKYIPIDCVICGTKMKTIHDTHNPFPVTDQCYAKESRETGNQNRCCSTCNSSVVLVLRISSTIKDRMSA